MQGNNPSDVNLEQLFLRSVNTELHSPQEIKVAIYSHKQALDYFNKSCFGRALAHFFVALRLIPEWRSQLRDIFWQALDGGCTQLIKEGRRSEAVSIKKDALLLYPTDKMILMDLGSLYYQMDEIELSLEYYKQALNVSPFFLPAYRSVQSIYNKVVERWHFRMLNDANRNEAYRLAIAHRILEGYSSVLDIGTGTGILSLYSIQEGAANVWACESNRFMFKTAQLVLAANKACDRVHLINKHSQHLSIPSDIPQKVSMIVTEVFDAGLLGEGILQVLIHAWENLLLPHPAVHHQTENEEAKEGNGIVIPFSAKIWVAAIQSIDIARRHRLLPCFCSCSKSETIKEESSQMKNPYFEIRGVKYCKLCGGPFGLHQTDKRDINFNLDDTFVAADSSEPYTTEDLETIPFGFEFLSKPCQVLEINFNSIEELSNYSSNKFSEFIVQVPIDTEGRIDAIASWFHLNMDNKGTIISTAPFHEEGIFKGTCWHQAIFPYSISRHVAPGEIVSLSVDLWDGILKVSETGRDCWPQKVRDSGNLLPRSKCALYSYPHYFVTEQMVAFLNNKTWAKALNATSLYLEEYFKQNPSSSKKILDMNIFPILGLQLLKNDSSWKLFAKAESETDKDYILEVAKRNLINVEQIRFVAESALEESIVGEYFDILNVNVVDPRGEMEENLTKLMPFLQERIFPRGVVVPHSVSIECQLIESFHLQKDSYVVTENSMGSFIIKDFINNYAVDYHLDIASQGLKFKALSDSMEVFKFRINSSDSDGICYEKSREVCICSTRSGTVTGVLYWMKLFFHSGSDFVSTLCHDSHCNQVAFLSSFHVSTGNEVLLKCMYMDGMLDVKLSRKVD